MRASLYSELKARPVRTSAALLVTWPLLLVLLVALPPVMLVDGLVQRWVEV
jgi:hypothetical protein